ncbi:hypothetical protein GCL60_07025 [Silvanigrella paludirubra]|uniref:Ethylmalonyl-CoA decarboxylase n=1 Tax=Silvanigrella paludirubra TaxID=2499159 RepID=A0A6N6VUL1_9BACT|nr:enoyl-CoA hydratase/isomerase family protein [Silvanigrella paludirubra]KAB8040010.1 hypothetical protein GCL60_07025 [Silvanigrella paludirubra]
MIKLVDGEEFSIIAKNNICFVTLNSATTKNAISLRMSSIMQSITIEENGNPSLFEKFINEQNCLLIVVKSDVEGIFSSGGNLSELEKNEPEACKYYSSSIKAFCKLLHSTNAPSVTLLSGPSFGGGVEFALATDYRWGIGKSYDFHFTQTKFGIPTGWGGMLRLTELCPQLSPRKVSSIILGKLKFDNSQLLNLGLVDKEFNTKKACQTALDEWVHHILDCPKYLIEELMNRKNIENLTDLEEYDTHIFNKYFLKDEHKIRIHKFLSSKKKK